MIRDSWNDITQQTIAKCWIKSSILAITHDQDLRNTCTENDFKTSVCIDEIKHICHQLKSLHLNTEIENMYNQKFIDKVNEIINDW